MRSAKPADGGSPSLPTSFAWSLIGNMVYAASQVGVLALLANLASPATVGRYALGLAIVTPILLFTKLQLRWVLATDVRRDYSFSDYLGTRLLSTAVGCGSVFLVLAVANFELDAAVMIGIVTLTKAVESRERLAIRSDATARLLGPHFDRHGDQGPRLLGGTWDPSDARREASVGTAGGRCLAGRCAGGV